MAVRPRKIEENSSKLGRARRLDEDRRAFQNAQTEVPLKLSDSILQQECANTLNGISIAERQARMRIHNKYAVTGNLRTPTLISKWVDYSNKHGFSYQLSSEDIGVLFNDGNSLLRVNHSNSFWYILNDKLEG